MRAFNRLALLNSCITTMTTSMLSTSIVVAPSILSIPRSHSRVISSSAAVSFSVLLLSARAVGLSSCPLRKSPLQLPSAAGRVFMASSEAASSMPTVRKSDEEWRAVLSPEQFRILRQKGTERGGTGKYDKFFDDGVYECAGCGTPLYKSTTKFDSGCGWPAFFEGLPGAITETIDADGRRIEITCTACGGHLGHTFKGEGFRTPTNERHCVNSISLKFTPANK